MVVIVDAGEAGVSVVVMVVDGNKDGGALVVIVDVITGVGVTVGVGVVAVSTGGEVTSPLNTANVVKWSTVAVMV